MTLFANMLPNVVFMLPIFAGAFLGAIGSGKKSGAIQTILALLMGIIIGLAINYIVKYVVLATYYQLNSFDNFLMAIMIIIGSGIGTIIAGLLAFYIGRLIVRVTTPKIVKPTRRIR